MIEARYLKPPGWWGTLTRAQQVRILALERIK